MLITIYKATIPVERGYYSKRPTGLLAKKPPNRDGGFTDYKYKRLF